MARLKLPPRRALGLGEIAAILKCILFYRLRGEDPGYDGYFEEKYTIAFSEFMGGGYTDAVSSGCASLFVALKSLKLPPCSLVGITPVTDSSVVGCIIEQGHVPYLFDSSPGSYNFSLRELEARFNSNLRALIVTHAGGEPVQMMEIKDFCDVHDIAVIEDCSQAIGATPKGQARRVGNFSKYACFSTMYRKNLSVSGSSGLVFCQNYEDFKVAKQHADRGKQWWNKEIVDMRDPGFAEFPALNWNSDELRCAIGLANLRRLEETNRKRCEFVKRLIYLMEESGIQMFRPYNFHDGFAPFYFPIFINKNRYKSVIDISVDLRNLGLGVGVKYGCLVSTWEWAKPHMYDDFPAMNALSTRDSCFHLYLNENYSATEAVRIVERLKRYEDSFN
jgi:perosamine synthetase